jgi:isoquinoline 1-oxidoreductase beta subunit
LVESFYNAFTLETFIDRLAKAGSGDPVELRLELLSQNPRARLVVEVCAEKSGWGKGSHLGPTEVLRALTLIPILSLPWKRRRR